MNAARRKSRPNKKGAPKSGKATHSSSSPSVEQNNQPSNVSSQDAVKPPQDTENISMEEASPRGRRALIITLLASTGLISICAIVFELVIASVSTYLLGNSVYQFSLTIGMYLSSMGLGSWLSQFIKKNLLSKFVLIELILGVLGGSSAVILYTAFGSSDANGAYMPVMTSLTIALGTCVGFEIPLMIRLIKQYATLSMSIANVLAADYVGSLLGSLAFPLLLLVYLGMMKTAFIIGMLNIIVALVTLFIFRKSIRFAPLYMLASLALMTCLLWAIFKSGEINARLERALYRDPIVKALQSKYQRIVVTRGDMNQYSPVQRMKKNKGHKRHTFVDQEEDFRLYLDGDLQFSSADEYRYHEALVHPGMSAVLRNRSQTVDVLVLGGGDGLAAREVFKYPQVRSMTLVDLDTAIVRLANTYAPLNELNQDALSNPRAEVTFGDAFNYIMNTPKRFDFIIVDLPDPDAAALSKLYSTAFYKMAAGRLKKNGYIVSQSTSPLFLPKAFWCINRTMAEADLNVAPYAVYIPSFGLWGFNLASKNEIESSSLRLALPEPNDTHFLTDTVMKGLFQLPKDVWPQQVIPNTLDKPIIVQYYLHDEQAAR